MPGLRSRLATAIALLGAAPACSAACIPSGTGQDIAAALRGGGSEAVLCPGAVFVLQAPVVFTAPYQRLYTEGLPTDAARAVLRVGDPSQATAIIGQQSGIDIESVEVDGGRPALGRLAQGAALIEIGGNATDQTVKNIWSHDPRGWSALHVIEGNVVAGVPACQRATIMGNQIGPAGMPAGQWADGISLACGNSVVSGNTVTDATDGGIVVFGAPGSLVSGNVITAASRTLLGGINLVDYLPTGGNYAGTIVQGNVIDAAGALIEAGIAMGPAVWGCDDRVNTGAAVQANLLTGDHMGYGYPVNGVDAWTATGNQDRSRHVGVPHAGCGGKVARPAAFQVQPGASGRSTLPGYVQAPIRYVLGVTEPKTLAALRQPAGCAGLSDNQGLAPGQSTASCDGRFALKLQTDGNLVLREGRTVLWSTGTAGRSVVQAIERSDGNLVLDDGSGAQVWASGSVGHPGASLVVRDDGNLVIDDGATTVWASGTCCH